ncbi:hypothetical protein K2Y00_02100 [Patescibacteria group bacterium]|nr:hypothetical protein [Patescibacteria group bacterium]
MNARSIVVAVVGLMFFVAPVHASAQTVPALLMQIQQLQEQLRALQNDTGGPSVPGNANQMSVEVDANDPLTATFKYVMNQEKSCEGGGYRLSFGDGDDEDLRFPADACNSYVQYTEHTYARAGTYTATLYGLKNSGEVILNQVTVTVGRKKDQPSCTITTNKSEVEIGESFRIKWSTKNIANPVLYENIKAGRALEVKKKGMKTYVGEYAGQLGFAISSGGLEGAYTPLCEVRVLVEGDIEDDPTDEPTVKPGIYPGTYYTTTPEISGTANWVGRATLTLDKTFGDKDRAYISDIAVDTKWKHTVTSPLPYGIYIASLYKPNGSRSLNETNLAGSAAIHIEQPVKDAQPSCSVTASKSRVPMKQSVTISWSSKYTSYAVGPGGDKLPASGSETYQVMGDKTYSYTFYGATGGKIGCSTTVYVETETPRPPTTDYSIPPTLSFRALPTRVVVGTPATLSWQTTNANRCVLQSTEGSEQDVGVSDSMDVYPYRETTYRMICVNQDPNSEKDGPAVEKSITVGVRESRFTPPLEAAALSAMEGQLKSMLESLKTLFSR